MPSTPKSGQIQIRVSTSEKDAIRRAARQAGMDMSAYVLARVLPAPRSRFQELAAACAKSPEDRFALEELNSWLASVGANELREAVSSQPPRMAPRTANYVAAMVEYACARSGVAAPGWTRDVEPLVEPMFGSGLLSLRLYLLSHSPAPFRRRNIFIDSSVGSRV